MTRDKRLRASEGWRASEFTSDAFVFAPTATRRMSRVRRSGQGRTMRGDLQALHLLDTTMLYTPSGGGVMRYLLAKRRWLATHTAFRHTLLVPGACNGEGAAGETFVRCTALPGIKYRVPADTASWGRAIASHRPDIVEVGDAGPVALAAFRARRRTDMAIVAFCHSDLERSTRTRYGGVAGRAVRAYARSVYRYADHVIAPSEYMRRRLAEWGVDSVTVCSLGTDLATFHPARRDPRLRARLGLPADARLFVYAGRFSTEKNLDTLFAAFARAGGPYHLLLVGDGPLPVRPPNSTVLPFLGDAESLARILASADAFVHAGDQETFGLGYVEAMACGLPVIAARDGAAPEIVTSDCGFLVAPRRVDALVEALHALYQSDRERMGRAARSRAADRYDWNKSFARLLRIYERVAGAALPRIGSPQPTTAPLT